MLDEKRKNPIQPRAVRTFETLLDAAAQVLQHEGEKGFTTNRVAEVAGFSIGTLYQYFPDKNAIAKALVQRQFNQMEQMLRRAISAADPDDLEAVIRNVVVAVIGAFNGRHQARRFLILHMMRLGLVPSSVAVVDTVSKIFIETIVCSGRFEIRPLSEAATFVLTRAISGTVRAAVIGESALLTTPAFQDELVQLVLRFVRP